MRFLLLGTNEYMFADQMANLADFAPGFTPENLQFMTYAAAMVAARNEVAAPKCDVIIADEFHHCGAPEWGKGVQYVIESNPEAKVIGFTGHTHSLLGQRAQHGRRDVRGQCGEQYGA